MLAYQMIYTACGKNRTGAFDVWAKSKCVTDAECDEICKVMDYRTPDELSYDPTEEEIRRLCPPKYAYLKLSTGRRCIAQSNYIGKVYSDLDSRRGNFIIHAYIFDNMGDYRPAFLFGTNAFKTKLTYQEWHDDPVPEDLPAVEVQAMMPQGLEMRLQGLLSAENKSVMMALLQAAIQSAKDGKKITIRDTVAKEQDIYCLFSTLLPRAVFEKLTFVTQYLTTNEYSIESTGIEPVRVRNPFKGFGGHFNYEEEAQMGTQYVFDFEKRVFSSVTPGKYVTDLVNHMATGKLFDVLAKAERMERIAAQLGCDLDTAVGVYYIAQKQLGIFKTAQEFNQALTLATRAGLVTKESLVAQIYASIVKPARYGYSPDAVELTRFVFAGSDAAVRDEIVEDYFNNMREYGVNAQSAPAEFVAAVKRTIPFSFEELCASAMRNPRWQDWIRKSTKKTECYLFFEIMCNVLGKNDPVQVKIASGVVLQLLKTALADRDMPQLTLYLDAAQALSPAQYNWLIENTVDPCFRAAMDRDGLQYAIGLLRTVNDSKTVERLKWLFHANVARPDFMQDYVALSAQYGNLFAAFERQMENDAEYKQFVAKKDIYAFGTRSGVSSTELDQYFVKYYKVGRDNGAFSNQLRRYVSSLPPREKLQECLRRYRALRDLSNSFADVARLIPFLEREMYQAPMADLMQLLPEQYGLLRDLNDRMRQLGERTSMKYELVEVLQVLRSRDAKRYITDGTLYNALNDAQMGQLVQNHMYYILCAYINEYNDRSPNSVATNTLLRNMFEPLLRAVPGAQQKLLEAADKLKDEDQYSFTLEIMVYAFNHQDALARDFKQMLLDYLDALSQGECKKLFKRIEAEIATWKNDDGVNALRFIEEYRSKPGKKKEAPARGGDAPSAKKRETPSRGGNVPPVKMPDQDGGERVSVFQMLFGKTDRSAKKKLHDEKMERFRNRKNKK